MKQVFFLSVIAVILCFAWHANGQDMAQGDVTIHGDARLDVLFKKKPASVKSVLASGVRHEDAKRPAGETTHSVTAAKGAQQAVKPVFLTSLRRGPAIYSGRGFRVQIYNGEDRGRAIKIKTEFMRHYPGVRTYLTYVSPSFRVKVGDYRYRSDAEGMLKEANSSYSPCMIVPDMITINTY